MTTLIASMTIVSCNNDKGNTKTESGDGGASTEMPEAKPSKVSESIAPVAQIFDGEKYVSTKLAHNTDYFIVYFTASW